MLGVVIALQSLNFCVLLTSLLIRDKVLHSHID